ncbi:MAG: DUF2586 family protein, partial [Bacteroidales bacterium]|nr:DUF2586 family protein [Bacteroidales bacterium]
MSISNITFTKEAGGLGRVLPGEDHVSGLIFYVANDQIEELLPVNSYPIKSLEELKEVKGQTRFFGEDGYTIADESPTAIIAYHVNEFFRMNPGATLWVSILSKKSPDFKEIADLQDKAEGKIRQIGIHDEKSNNIKDAVDTIKTQTDALSGKYRAVSVVYSNTNKLKGMTVEEYKALEISGWDSKYVSVSIGQSGSEQMKKLQKNTYYRLEEHPLNVKITKSGDVISGVKLVSSKGIVFPEVLKSFYFGENKVFYKSITDDKKTFEIKPKDYSVFEGLNEKEIKIRFDNEYSATVNIEYNSDSKTIKKISLTFGDKIKALNTPEVFLYDGKEYSVNTVQRDTDKKIIAIDVKSEYFESFKSLNQEKVKIRFRCESKDNKKAVGCVGALAGAVSKAAVHENIGWVQRFNLGAEFSDPMLMNGDSV